jgi:hypothetical protein
MKSNAGLVAHAEKALQEKWGYVYGTFGQILTPELLEAKRKQYPTRVNQFMEFIKTHWMGRRVTDCVGLIKSYMWDGSGYDLATDKSADGMLLAARSKGPIAEIPEIIGALVWKKGHIGVYVGKGWVIESNSTKKGVIKTPLKGQGSTPWTDWLLCPYIQYAMPKPDPVKPVAVDPYQAAVKVLKEANVIDSPDFWAKISGSVDAETVKLLIIKIARRLKP